MPLKSRLQSSLRTYGFEHIACLLIAGIAFFRVAVLANAVVFTYTGGKVLSYPLMVLLGLSGILAGVVLYRPTTPLERYVDAEPTGLTDLFYSGIIACGVLFIIFRDIHDLLAHSLHPVLTPEGKLALAIAMILLGGGLSVFTISVFNKHFTRA